MAGKQNFDSQPIPSSPGGPDRFTRAGAGAIATAIENYWHRRGFNHVRAWVEPFREFSRRSNEVFVVKSNLKLSATGGAG